MIGVREPLPHFHDPPFDCVTAPSGWMIALLLMAFVQKGKVAELHIREGANIFA